MMPTPVSANNNATVLAIAEKASELIIKHACDTARVRIQTPVTVAALVLVWNVRERAPLDRGKD
jgi:choline dehydrogenase-like flavoprotein